MALATSCPEGRPSWMLRSRLRFASVAGPEPVSGSGSRLSGNTSELSSLYDAWGCPIVRGAGPILKKKLQSIAKFDGDGRKPPRFLFGSSGVEKTGSRFSTVV